MDVNTKTETTYVVSMTADQARDLLRIARAIDDDVANCSRGELETLSTLRQALLSSGLTLKDSE